MATDQNGQQAGPGAVVPDVQAWIDQQQARWDAEKAQLESERDQYRDAAATGEAFTSVIQRAMEYPQLAEALNRLHTEGQLPQDFNLSPPGGGNPPVNEPAVNPTQPTQPQPTPAPSVNPNQPNGQITMDTLQGMFREYHKGLMHDIKPVADTILKRQSDDDVAALKKEFTWAPQIMDKIADRLKRQPGLTMRDAAILEGREFIEQQAKQKGEEEGARRALFAPTLEPTPDVNAASPDSEEAQRAQAEVDQLMKSGQTEDATRKAMENAIRALNA